MPMFPETPVEVLSRLASQCTGEREASWRMFFELYEPVIAAFARLMGAGHRAEDIVQDVFVKLIGVFDNGEYDREKGRFRTYLSTIIKREVISQWRKASARQENRQVSMDDDRVVVEPSVPSVAGEVLDREWMRARHEAAVRQVLEKTAVSAKVKAIYRAYAVEDGDIAEVAERFGTTRNYVSQIKHRLDAMVIAFEKMMSD